MTIHEGKAYFDLPVVRAIDNFITVAQASGLGYERTEQALHVIGPLGSFRLSGTGQGTALVISSDRIDKLQDMRDQMTARITALGLTLNWQDQKVAGRPVNLSLARIETITRLSPSYMRITMCGPDLARFGTGGLHFRLLFGPAGANWPQIDAAGVTQWPGGGMTAWHRPVYTTRRFELLGSSGAARITFDVFLHDGGRVTEWTRTVQPGDKIAITGPGGSKLPDRSGWLGVIGDETAVPVAARLLAGVDPATRGEAILFVSDPADIQQLAHPEGVSLRWIIRGGTETPVSAFDSMAYPEADRFLFFAAERRAAVELRPKLTDAGFQKSEYHAAAYWTD
ncbi:siderophore-interacting protein [Puniceibacterium sp. IMCC21224]|uniref:siderophore-interacting protein n=1 Tax=Puniceibacterium sp. IMCC21224 TaxID=1618204 RepID=UPI00065DB35F|nr:siderophore-interacting protein [Puniceibacterium sp. IMCC21224]KMK64990.1 siderophore-interacting protein [Puniceibacterium sp. IMCC21224]